MRAHKSKNPKHEANPKIQTQIQSTNPKSKDRKQEGITLQMQAPPIAIAPEALLHKITQMQLQCTCTEAAAHKSKNPKHEANPKIQTQIQSTNPKSKDRKQEGREKAVQRCTKQWYLWCWSLAPMGQPEQVHGIVIFESTNAA